MRQAGLVLALASVRPGVCTRMDSTSGVAVLSDRLQAAYILDKQIDTVARSVPVVYPQLHYREVRRGRRKISQ